MDKSSKENILEREQFKKEEEKIQKDKNIQIIK